MSHRSSLAIAAAFAALLIGGLVAPLSAQAPARRASQSEIPRTPDGRPDLQGNWSNATITPIQRPEGQPPVLSSAEVAQIEGNRASRIEEAAAPTDPDRAAPPVGGDGSSGAAGGVGGYNYFWIDAGDRVAIVNGQARSSLIMDPESGRRPPLTQEAQRRMSDARASAPRFGQYDNPENRPMAERCILSFGSNLGPPMLPNYFYNNNYTIVQTADHVMIMTEMVHDVRVIRLGDRKPLPAHIRPYGGDSWGRWVGDTLVVETTNIHPDQGLQGIAPTEALRVLERFTRVDANKLNYEFTVIDPSTYTQPWGGEVPYNRLDAQVYEYACHEGNYALANVLSGARAEERRAAQAGPAQPR
ncbi:MAG: hypothetical protein FJ207_12500 [Gemmatimonadetes bacterium]|nr:hypothetical protein [Gemmatimonadota bacterium]